jgi:hypothetical protein
MVMAPKSSKPTTPEDFPSQPNVVPSGDYSYTLEIVMNMQHTLGGLAEAVKSLKEDSKEYRTELKELSKNFHAAQVLIRWLIAVAVGLGGLIGWAINAYIAATHK